MVQPRLYGFRGRPDAVPVFPPSTPGTPGRALPSCGRVVPVEPDSDSGTQPLRHPDVRVTDRSRYRSPPAPTLTLWPQVLTPVPPGPPPVSRNRAWSDRDDDPEPARRTGDEARGPLQVGDEQVRESDVGDLLRLLQEQAVPSRGPVMQSTARRDQ